MSLEMLTALIPGLLIAVVTLSGTLGGNAFLNYLAGKRAARLEAYNSFYLPFITLMYTLDVWTLNFSDLSKEMKLKFIALILPNIRYMSQPVLEWVDVFYFHFAASLELDGEAVPPSVPPARLDEVFSYFVEATLAEADELAKKLHQPRLGEHALSLYRESSPQYVGADSVVGEKPGPNSGNNTGAGS